MGKNTTLRFHPSLSFLPNSLLLPPGWRSNPFPVPIRKQGRMQFESNLKCNRWSKVYATRLRLQIFAVLLTRGGHFLTSTKMIGTPKGAACDLTTPPPSQWIIFEWRRKFRQLPAVSPRQNERCLYAQKPPQSGHFFSSEHWNNKILFHII